MERSSAVASIKPDAPPAKNPMESERSDCLAFIARSTAQFEGSVQFKEADSSKTPLGSTSIWETHWSPRRVRTYRHPSYSRYSTRPSSRAHFKRRWTSLVLLQLIPYSALANKRSSPEVIGAPSTSIIPLKNLQRLARHAAR